MKNLLTKLLLVTLVLLSRSAAARQTTPYEHGQALVQLKQHADPVQVIAHLEDHFGMLAEVKWLREVSRPMRIHLVGFNEDRVPMEEFLRALSVTPGVQVAQRNHIGTERYIPNDPFFNNQWHHIQSGDHDIDTDLAWDITTGGTTAFGDEIVACVIETGGADWDHTDLLANHWVNNNEIPDNGLDDDDNGYVDDYDGWNIVNNSDQLSGGNHGTAVSSMLGGTGDNNTGVAGVNHSVSLMQIQMGSINESNVLEAYTYPLVMRKRYNETGGSEGAFVVVTNASWGVDNGDPADSPLWCAMYDTLGTYGVLNCGATANNNVNIDVVGDLPTACPSDYMIAVTATNDNDERTFSGYGITQIDLGAPGEDVYLASNTNNYSSTSGTSFASPCTAGGVALLYSADCVSLMALVQADPAAAAELVKTYILEGVDPVSNLSDEVATGGRLNVYNSLLLLLAECSSSPCIAPFNVSANQVEGQLDYVITWGTTESMVSFSLRYREAGELAWTTTDNIDTDTFTLENLAACTTYEVQLLASCGDTDSDWSDTFTFETTGCCENPPAASVLVDFTDPDTFISWEAVFGAVNYTVTIYDDNNDQVFETQVTTNSLIVEGLSPCTPYAVGIGVACEGANGGTPETVEFTTTGCGNCSDLEYCSITGSASLEWIERVAIGLIDNTSGSNNGYGDFTNLSTPVEPGMGYSIELTPGFAGFGFSEYFLVWLDLDGDGAFESSELAYDPGTTTTTLITGNILIPADQEEGPVRMRVGMAYLGGFGGGALPVPCGENEYGETEDYCLEVTAPVSGVTEAAAAAVSLWPVPAQGYLEVQAPVALASTAVYDLSGRCMLSNTHQSNRITLGLDNLAPGLYALHMTLRNGAVLTRQFVVE